MKLEFVLDEGYRESDLMTQLQLSMVFIQKVYGNQGISWSYGSGGKMPAPPGKDAE